MNAQEPAVGVVIHGASGALFHLVVRVTHHEHGLVGEHFNHVDPGDVPARVLHFHVVLVHIEHIADDAAFELAAQADHLVHVIIRAVFVGMGFDAQHGLEHRRAHLGACAGRRGRKQNQNHKRRYGFSCHNPSPWKLVQAANLRLCRR